MYLFAGADMIDKAYVKASLISKPPVSMTKTNHRQMENRLRSKLQEGGTSW